MTWTRIGVGVVAVAAVLFGLAAQASPVIFDHGPALADPNHPGQASYVPLQQVAEDFSLAPDHSVITDVHWWGFDIGTPATDFRLRIFADENGQPAASPLFDVSLDNLTATGTGQFQFVSLHNPLLPVLEYGADVTPISLIPDTNYWLSIVSTQSNDWIWEYSAYPGDEPAFRTSDSGAWTFLGPFATGELAYRLTGVPEPATAGLLGLALVGLATWSRGMRRESAPDARERRA